MASSFKRIKLFSQDPIDQPPQNNSKQEFKTIEDVQVIHMIYLDMFFFFLGTPKLTPLPDGTMPQFAKEYFYFTKNMQIRQEYKIHTQTVYIDKFNRGGDKKIVSLGRDVNYNNPQVPEDMGWIVKVWDFNNFVQDGKPLVESIFFRLYSCWRIRPHWWVLACRRNWRSDESNARFTCLSWRYRSQNVQTRTFY